jgi:hypothetical protein
VLFIYGAERRWLMLKIKWATAPSRSPFTPTGTSFPEQTLHGASDLMGKLLSNKVQPSRNQWLRARG